ncbi:hypothetical protein E4U53_007681 [Claviceps sorghi]|nr:hypothetical protein E4U53_007681 [Claviceps sorghi]
MDARHLSSRSDLTSTPPETCFSAPSSGTNENAGTYQDASAPALRYASAASEAGRNPIGKRVVAQDALRSKLVNFNSRAPQAIMLVRVSVSSASPGAGFRLGYMLQDMYTLASSVVCCYGQDFGAHPSSFQLLVL